MSGYLGLSFHHLVPGAMAMLFWASLFLVLYSYAGYPFFLWVMTRFRRRGVRGNNYQPFVSVVIAVLNEESTIRGRLENLLRQDYPKDKREIIVVSDGCVDRTCDIVKSFVGNNVRLIDLGSRQGKALAINAGVAEAKGEIIVFADARQRFEQNAIAHLVSNFSDPAVGCVSGELLFVKDDTSLIQTEMGAYWSYEKWIRKMESATGSVVGATGAIYAIRRELYKPLPPDTILDDVLIPLMVVAQGYRCIFDGSAIAYDIFSKDTTMEWRRKVRTLAGNWQLLSLRPELVAPWKNPLWLRFFSHKIMRLIVPFALLVLFCSGAALQGVVYRAATVLQFMLYGAALAGLTVSASRGIRLVSLCHFFLVMNAAIVAGFWLWLTGRSRAVWKTEAGSAVRG